MPQLPLYYFVFFNYTATHEIYTYLHPLALHDALPIYGVVRRAQDQQLCPRIGGLALEVLQVHAVGAVLVDQPVRDDLGAVVLRDPEERVVDRPLHDHPVARGGEAAHHHVQRRHHAGGGDDPVAFDRPVLAPREPRANGVVIAVGLVRVTEDAVLDPLAHRLDDRLRTAEVHVRHPHGQRAVGAVPPARPVPVAGDATVVVELPFDRVSAFPIDLGVEVQDRKSGVGGKRG